MAQLQKVCYGINDIDNDVIVFIGNTPVSGILAKDLARNSNGDYWLEKDRNNVPVLCTYAEIFSTAELTLNDGVNNYTVVAVDFIGGRPPVIRK